jgi:integrase
LHLGIGRLPTETGTRKDVGRLQMEGKRFVFTSGIGTPLEPRNLQRAWDQILAVAGLPHSRIHDLRHPAATLLLSQGVHPRVVMDLLGHSQIAVTMNTYSHVVPALRKEAADQIDAILKFCEASCYQSCYQTRNRTLQLKR